MNDVADLRILIWIGPPASSDNIASGTTNLPGEHHPGLLAHASLHRAVVVLVDTSSKNLLDLDAATTNGLTDNSRVEGEVRIIQSDAALVEAIKDGNLLADPEFASNRFKDRLLSRIGFGANAASGDTAAGEVLSTFKDAVRVRGEGLTYLIGVGVASDDAEKAARLANLVTAVYIKKQVEAKVASAVSAGIRSGVAWPS